MRRVWPAAQGREIDCARSADDAELIAVDVRVPADVDDGARPGGVVDENGCGILDGRLMNDV